MSLAQVSTAFRHETAFARGLKILAAEANAFLDAILYPGKLIAEVQAMRRLLVEAQRIEATDPDRASLLRRRAARLAR